MESDTSSHGILNLNIYDIHESFSNQIISTDIYKIRLYNKYKSPWLSLSAETCEPVFHWLPPDDWTG